MASATKIIWPADSELAPAWHCTTACKVDRITFDHSVNGLPRALRAPGPGHQSHLSDDRSLRYQLYLQSPIEHLALSH